MKLFISILILMLTVEASHAGCNYDRYEMVRQIQSQGYFTAIESEKNSSVPIDSIESAVSLINDTTCEVQVAYNFSSVETQYYVLRWPHSNETPSNWNSEIVATPTRKSGPSLPCKDVYSCF